VRQISHIVPHPANSFSKQSERLIIMSSAANPTHEVHRGDIPYQAPFARSASPNDSLTTTYEADDTNLSDAELSDDAFSIKVLNNLRIYEKRDEEERAEARPLIMPRLRRGSTSGQTEPDEGGWTIVYCC